MLLALVKDVTASASDSRQWHMQSSVHTTKHHGQSLNETAPLAFFRASTWNLLYSMTRARILPETLGNGMLSDGPVSVKAGRAWTHRQVVVRRWQVGIDQAQDDEHCLKD